MKRNCLQCGTSLQGRSDKRYCSVACKNEHNHRNRSQTKEAVAEIDSYLHRNREILATLMGDSNKETLDRAVLTRAKFRWEYMTGIYKNKQGKWYHLVYDYAWMEFTDQHVMIVRKANPTAGK
jgi:hypothetical protein